MVSAVHFHYFHGFWVHYFQWFHLKTDVGTHTVVFCCHSARRLISRCGCCGGEVRKAAWEVQIIADDKDLYAQFTCTMKRNTRNSFLNKLLFEFKYQNLQKSKVCHFLESRYANFDGSQFYEIWKSILSINSWIISICSRASEEMHN